MFKFLLIILFFLLPGCGEQRCIKPEGLSNLREKLDIVSTGQKWVDSSVKISGTTKVTEINIVPSKINFCTNLYEDFTIRPGKTKVKLPFELKKNDKVSFSVIGIKGCKSNEDGELPRYVKIDENCNEEETAHFAKILNQEECQRYKDIDICPNKYTIGNAEWLNGREYWNSDLSKSDRDKEERDIKGIINSIKEGQKIDCNKLSDDQKSKIDTYLLNLACEKTCYYPGNNCVEIESSTIDDGNVARNLGSALSIEASKIIEDILKKEINSYIPSLQITVDNEKFEYLKGGIRTNYDYEIENDHPEPESEKLTFNLGGAGKGGYNVRVAKHSSLEKSLYIHVSDKFPEHNPGDNEAEDILVDINKIYDLPGNLQSKSGTIYYGVRDHGCDYKNEGEFSINITTKEPHVKTFSVIYDFFDREVKTAFFGSSYNDPNAIHSDTSPAKSLYQSFVASNRTNTIRSTIVALLVLYIILYTLYYFFGLTHLSIYEFLIVCLKIGIIAQLLQDNSWNFFYNNAFSLFINAPAQLIGSIANFRGDLTKETVFQFLDLPLSRFLSSNSILLTISLIFSGPLGVVSFYLVIWGLIIVVFSIFNALFSYVTSIAIIALLLSLAPIFIICVLFQYTREMFKKWIGYLVRFSIHPVVLLIFISLISQVMDYIVYSMFDFEICSTCILPINLKIFDFCMLYGYVSKSSPNITAIFAFVILGHAMKALIEASAAISDSLSSSYISEESEPSQQYKQSLLGVVGLDQESVRRRSGESPKASGATNQRPPESSRPVGK